VSQRPGHSAPTFPTGTTPGIFPPVTTPPTFDPWPEPFELARQRLLPALQAYGFRVFSLEYPDAESPHAIAEFHRAELRLRLVWEGEVRSLWLEVARQAGSEIVSRWRDVEWAVAGERLPLDHGLDEARVDRLITALGLLLAGTTHPEPA